MILYVHTAIQDELESTSEDADEMEVVSDCEGSDKRSSVAGSSHKANEGSSSCAVAKSGRPTRSASKNVHYGEDESDDEEG
jgi:hypothetical protein